MRYDIFFKGIYSYTRRYLLHKIYCIFLPYLPYFVYFFPILPCIVYFFLHTLLLTAAVIADCILQDVDAVFTKPPGTPGAERIAVYSDATSFEEGAKVSCLGFC
jgi:hypothetical protein